MHRLDVFMLDRVHQPICDALYDRVGDCIIIARWLLAQVVGLTVCVLILYVSLHAIDWSAGFYLMPQMLIIGSMIICRRVLRFYLGRTGLNPLRYIIFPVRIVMLLLVAPISLMTLVFIVLVLSFDLDTLRMGIELVRDIGMLSSFYFASCHNMPPPRRVTVPAHA